MGSSEKEKDREADEGPQGNVSISPFWMAAFEVSREDAVIAIEIRLILHQTHATQVVELIQAAGDDAFAQRLEQGEKLFDGDRDATLFELEEEVGEHLF